MVVVPFVEQIMGVLCFLYILWLSVRCLRFKIQEPLKMSMCS